MVLLSAVRRRWGILRFYCIESIFFQVNGKVLASAKKLKIVGRAGVGVDNIDIAQATK